MKSLYKQNLQQLLEACKPHGILASTEAIDNYARVWARDSLICGLTGLWLQQDEVTQSLKASLLLLAKHQGPNGEIPSNISVNEKGQAQDISYGSTVGRVDALGWFVIGACHLMKVEPSQEAQLLPAVKKALGLYQCLEFNLRGFVYTPQGGNWADDYILEGYLLYDQLIRLWAMRSYEQFTSESLGSELLENLIKINFWPQHENLNHSYRPRAFESYCTAHPEPNFWACGFKPDGYYEFFDLFANSLSMILNLNSPSQTQALLDYTKSLTSESGPLLPAFTPVIDESSTFWSSLNSIYGPKFKNHPHEYHNGGLWPMLNGWWALALKKHGHIEQSEAVLASLSDLNDKNDSLFYEYYHGESLQPGGAKKLTWSAAVPLLALSYDDEVEKRILC